MNLYIWEGNGISDAYHDDGTLVILAHSPEEARQIAQPALICENTDADHVHDDGRWSSCYGARPEGWDGASTAIDREPDRVIPVRKPVVVSFNGGGYD